MWLSNEILCSDFESAIAYDEEDSDAPQAANMMAVHCAAFPICKNGTGETKSGLKKLLSWELAIWTVKCQGRYSKKVQS